MLKGLFLLLFINLYINFSFSQEKIYFIGHAYGSPLINDNKMDPSVLNFFKKNNSKLIYGGDFVQSVNNPKEIEEFLNFNSNRDYILIAGNHDVSFEAFDHQKNTYEITNRNLFIYLNTNFKTESQVDESIDFLRKTIHINDFKNVLIFSHQLFFSKSKYDIKTNSREYYSKANKFYDSILGYLKGVRKDVYLYSGDIGAFKYNPYAYYNKIDNITYLATGLGNGSKNTCIEILINPNGKINNSFIDLDNEKRYSPEKFLRWKVKLYQLPKLLLFFIKDSYLIIIFILSLAFIIKILQIIRNKTSS